MIVCAAVLKTVIKYDKLAANCGFYFSFYWIKNICWKISLINMNRISSYNYMQYLLEQYTTSLIQMFITFEKNVFNIF